MDEPGKTKMVKQISTKDPENGKRESWEEGILQAS